MTTRRQFIGMTTALAIEMAKLERLVIGNEATTATQQTNSKLP